MYNYHNKLILVPMCLSFAVLCTSFTFESSIVARYQPTRILFADPHYLLVNFSYWVELYFLIVGHSIVISETLKPSDQTVDDLLHILDNNQFARQRAYYSNIRRYNRPVSCLIGQIVVVAYIYKAITLYELPDNPKNLLIFYITIVCQSIYMLCLIHDYLNQAINMHLSCMILNTRYNEIVHVLREYRHSTETNELNFKALKYSLNSIVPLYAISYRLSAFWRNKVLVMYYSSGVFLLYCIYHMSTEVLRDIDPGLLVILFTLFLLFQSYAPCRLHKLAAVLHFLGFFFCAWLVPALDSYDPSLT
ncbi:hypothetical protein GZH46_01639 [Fragariocoptes setiger]|uniref:Uncharacterized protein n=1 Tax=Fragariocoptes setiger TaxID=1670756 RepID=A0ABQ7S8T5_9ACAR|nr:hypothetical protein GZH46_01639 [Fragariocoptes setiger]